MSSAKYCSVPGCPNMEENTGGPGPGAYLLPTTVGFPAHDPSRYRMPMFSFGVAGNSRLKGLGPGAGAYRIDHVTRDGVVSSPAWTFGSRVGYRSIVKTPGPGAHAPERCPLMKDQRPPAYSMGARLDRTHRRIGPAPNAYAIRFGSGTPAWTMAARNPPMKNFRSPGPAQYFQKDQNVYSYCYPRYSLGARLDRGLKTKSPGPACYPPNLYNTKKNPYCYSFGTHHSDCAPPMIVREDTMDCL